MPPASVIVAGPRHRHALGRAAEVRRPPASTHLNGVRPWPRPWCRVMGKVLSEPQNGVEQVLRLYRELGTPLNVVPLHSACRSAIPSALAPLSPLM